MLTKSLLVFGVLLSGLNLLASASSMTIQKGEKVYFESWIVDTKKSTLILLPGIYRGLQQEDAFIKLLEKKKINYVSLHFSAHPKTILEYAAGETLVFSGGKGLTSQMIAHEVETAASKLKIQKPIIVSLSYSASVTPFLNPKKFPLVIETAPIATFDENDPEGAAFRKSWEQWAELWPIWGHLWVESYKDMAYRDYWSKVAKERVQSDAKLNEPENLNRLTEGYMAMARAIENYDIRNQDFTTTPRRIWILAENEDPNRRKIQDEAVDLYNKTLNLRIEPIVIKNSGHTIPSEQPAVYAEVLSAIVKKMDASGSTAR